MRNSTKFTKRQNRLIGLLRRGPLMREDLDKKAGCSNGPELVAQLRRKGIEIFCEKVSVIDRDGEVRQSGRYEFASGALDTLQALGWVASE